jgi:hypothetical protein
MGHSDRSVGRTQQTGARGQLYEGGESKAEEASPRDNGELLSVHHGISGPSGS